jgi:antirestriction protein ArdC
MNSNFKPLTEQVANKLIAQLEQGTSVFQQAGKPLQIPFNPTTNNKYRGAAALVLLMSGREDPRWMSLENANYNKTPVSKGEKGTLISFYKTSEMKPVMKDGKPVLKENGKPQLEKVQLPEPELTTVFLWNGEQLRKIAAYEPETTPDRLPSILENSQTGAPSLKALAEHLVAAKPSDSGIKDALVANIAELFVSAELRQPFDLGDHIGYLASWSQLLREQPAELFKAANDAQKIADMILGFEKKKEMNSTLNKDDLISYKGDTYKILSILKGKTAQVENGEGKKFKVGPKDKLYTSLLEAKKNPEKQQSRSQAVPAAAEKEETAKNYQYAQSI